MNKRGPIIFVEDDEDDRKFYVKVLQQINPENSCLFFENGEVAFQYLLTHEVKPFIIFAEINMPKMDGLELRKRIFKNNLLNYKFVPFVFLSTSKSKSDIVKASSKRMQGYFDKPNSLEETSTIIKSILYYWQLCVTPDED